MGGYHIFMFMHGEIESEGGSTSINAHIKSRCSGPARRSQAAGTCPKAGEENVVDGSDSTSTAVVARPGDEHGARRASLCIDGIDACIYLHMYVYVYTYTYMHVYIYVCIYTQHATHYDTMSEVC